jgi:hypothetical protein
VVEKLAVLVHHTDPRAQIGDLVAGDAFASCRGWPTCPEVGSNSA